MKSRSTSSLSASTVHEVARYSLLDHDLIMRDSLVALSIRLTGTVRPDRVIADAMCLIMHKLERALKAKLRKVHKVSGPLAFEVEVRWYRDDLGWLSWCPLHY